jgi:hypothetical protein
VPTFTNRVDSMHWNAQQPGAAPLILVPCLACGKDVSEAAMACPPCGHRFRTVTLPPPRQWHRGVAAVLSLVVPGLGQGYKGQVVPGLVWFGLPIAG